jgi:hypothetical protein
MSLRFIKSLHEYLKHGWGKGAGCLFQYNLSDFSDHLEFHLKLPGCGHHSGIMESKAIWFVPT